MRALPFKKTVVLLLMTFILANVAVYGAGGITVTEKIKLVILPGKVGTGWNMDAIDSLMAILEEQALELGRFQLFSRSDIQAIMKERNLSEFGVSEAIEIGKLGGSKYALLLSLEELSASWDSKNSRYNAISRYTIRLYNVENGELLASKFLQSSGSAKESAQKAISDALKATAGSILSFLRETFKLEAYVKSVTGDTVMLAGVDPKLARIGYIFQIETDTGVGYVKVVSYNKAEGTLVTKFMYGERPNVYDVAQEYPTLPGHGGLALSLFYGMPGLGLSVWSDAMEGTPVGFYLGLGTFLGTFGSETPVYFNIGANFKFLELGRIGASVNAGLSILGLADLESGRFKKYIFGLFGGGILTYEFNPQFGIFLGGGYTLYLESESGMYVQLGVYF
ncbi:hypothetical protein [Fervidobacterium thailandense]|uniref:Uncharacterized protein n=1 Tax=Fervidobacterium thailandense TaxID=1008305 RepID=A0A1E3G567_9BACT|nr:hypothetical protein [Fervidobacterium thailandense]ODN31379.1 hypothetical protein A4H02_01055 [Fervidobacterium thailandense]